MNGVTAMPDIMTAGVGAAMAIYVILVIIMAVLQIIAYWRIFEKAGEQGWKSLIPVYSSYVIYRIAWDVKAFWLSIVLSLLTWIPVVGFLAAIALVVISVSFYLKLAKAYGHGGGFAAGLIFLSPIFTLILGFDQSEYIGPQR